MVYSPVVPQMYEWKKNPSIENAYNGKFLNEIRNIYSVSKGVSRFNDWILTEKAHGSCISFFLEQDKEVKCFSRIRELTDEKMFEQLYNSQPLFEKYIPHVKKMLSILVKEGHKSVTVYGELIGGKYADKTSECNRVQKEVEYHPEHEFYAFNVCVDGSFLPYDRCIELFEACGFYYAKILFRGTFEEVLKWSADHNEDITQIPSLFGFEELKDNIREGHVLRPNIPTYTKKGSSICLKDKNKKFVEKHKEKCDKIPVELPEDTKVELEKALPLVTEQRFANVVSKIGIVTKKDFGRLIADFTNDVMEDYVKEDYVSLKGESKKKFNKEVSKACAIIIKKCLDDLPS